MEAHEGLVQSILFPTVMMGGDVPQGVPKDDRIVSLVQLFTSAAAMEAWKASSLQDAGAYIPLGNYISSIFVHVKPKRILKHLFVKALRGV